MAHPFWWMVHDCGVCYISSDDPDVCVHVKIIFCPHRIIHSSDTLDKADLVLSKLPVILWAQDPACAAVSACVCVCVWVSPLVHYYLIDVWKTLICKAWSIKQHRAHYSGINLIWEERGKWEKTNQRKRERRSEREKGRLRNGGGGVAGKTIHFPHRQIPLIPHRHLI